VGGGQLENPEFLRNKQQKSRGGSIAGFLFCVRTREFQTGRFYFDSELTAAFSEEEDLSMQFLHAGARMVVVPTDKFEHAGRGTDRMRSIISYFDQSIGRNTLLARNLNFVRKKWKHKSIEKFPNSPSI
jgi:hypothetical protein